MGKKGVEEMIDEIEAFVEGCKFQPLSSNKIVVPKDELERMLSELKLKLPSEIERCKKIMRNKEAILASARTRSDAIISESVNEANRLVEQSHITELANARANEIMESAREEADRVLTEAKTEATEVRMGAMMYTKEKISNIKQFMEAQLEAENENYKNLVDSLEQGIFTLSNNLSEVETSINLINGTPEAALYGDNYGDDGMDFDDGMGLGMGTPAMAPMTPAAGVDADDDYDDDDYDDDDYDDDDDFLDD